MEVNVYTQNKIFSQSESNLYKYFEYVLLLIVAFTGLFCSGIALADNAALPNNKYNRQISTFESNGENGFDNSVKITGVYLVDSKLKFDLNLDLTSNRYIMEMGDGLRMIITQPSFEYAYKAKGQYLIELKELQRGLLVNLGQKRITIK
jgi:hypothetical protein